MLLREMTLQLSDYSFLCFDQIRITVSFVHSHTNLPHLFVIFSPHNKLVDFYVAICNQVRHTPKILHSNINKQIKEANSTYLSSPHLSRNPRFKSFTQYVLTTEISLSFAPSNLSFQQQISVEKYILHFWYLQYLQSAVEKDVCNCLHFEIFSL